MKKIFTFLVILLMLCSCASETTNEDVNGTDINDVTKRTDNLNVQETPASKLDKSLTEQNYMNIFTALVPEGWQITTGGTDWYLWTRIYDPSNPSLQVFTAISTTCILKSDKAKAFYEWAYDISYDKTLYASTKDMVVNEDGDVEEFFEDYMDYIAWIAQYDPTFAGFDFPLIKDFEDIEDWDIDNELSAIAKDNKMIHAEFNEGLSMQRSEGLFTATFTEGISMMDPGYDCGFYILYNINGITAPYGMLVEYEEVLRKIIGSIAYTEDFVNTAMRNQQTVFENAMQINQIMQQTSQIIVDGWNDRQKTYDRISQAYSDSTLGYDRYYDTVTGEVYRVEYGVMDNYTGDRYQLIENDSDLYSLPVSGYVFK